MSSRVLVKSMFFNLQKVPRATNSIATQKEAIEGEKIGYWQSPPL